MPDSLFEAADLLEDAADLINAPYRWTRKGAARDKDGNLVSPDSPVAVRWCAIGAISRLEHERNIVVTGTYVSPVSVHVREALRDALDHFNITVFNDHLANDHTEMVAAMREAATHLRARGARAEKGGVTCAMA